MIPRRKALKRSAPPRKRKRTASERERIYGPPGFVEWIHEQPCACCRVVGYSEAAHMVTGGTGRKADWTTIAPLCRTRTVSGWLAEGCHALAHRRGMSALAHREPSFNPETAMVKTQNAWAAR